MSDSAQVVSDFSTMLEGNDVGYSSSFWDEAVASQIFMIPNLGKEVGFKLLDSVLEAGVQEFTHLIARAQTVSHKMFRENRRAQRVVEAVRASAEAMATQAIDDGMFDINDATASYPELRLHLQACADGHVDLAKVVKKLQVTVEYGNAALDLFESLGLVCRLATSLNRVSREYAAATIIITTTPNDDMLENVGEVMKVTIGMKCLDAAWGKMRLFYKEFFAAQAAWLGGDDFSFPYEKYAPFHDLEDLDSEFEAETDPE